MTATIPPTRAEAARDAALEAIATLNTIQGDIVDYYMDGRTMVFRFDGRNGMNGHGPWSARRPLGSRADIIYEWDHGGDVGATDPTDHLTSSHMAVIADAFVKANRWMYAVMDAAVREACQS